MINPVVFFYIIRGLLLELQRTGLINTVDYFYNSCPECYAYDVLLGYGMVNGKIPKQVFKYHFQKRRREPLIFQGFFSLEILKIRKALISRFKAYGSKIF